jgi:hypothetical protein
MALLLLLLLGCQRQLPEAYMQLVLLMLLVALQLLVLQAASQSLWCHCCSSLTAMHPAQQQRVMPLQVVSLLLQLAAAVWVLLLVHTRVRCRVAACTAAGDGAEDMSAVQQQQQALRLQIGDPSSLPTVVGQLVLQMLLLRAAAAEECL